MRWGLGWYLGRRRGTEEGASHIIHRASGSVGASFGSQVASLWSSCSPYWWSVKVNESISASRFSSALVQGAGKEGAFRVSGTKRLKCISARDVTPGRRVRVPNGVGTGTCMRLRLEGRGVEVELLYRYPTIAPLKTGWGWRVRHGLSGPALGSSTWSLSGYALVGRRRV